MIRVPTNRVPTHPGQILLEDFLIPLDISQRELSDSIQVPFQRVNEIVNGRRGITPATALRLARFFGMSADFWLNLQLRWDLFHAQQKESEALAIIQPYNPQRRVDNQRQMAMVYRKVRIGEQDTDRGYWLSQSPEARFAALEGIRRDYHAWKYSTEPGFKGFLQSLNDNNVRYLVIGGYALAFHGHPRYTKDLDIWIDLDEGNADKVVRALDDFGFASLELKAADFLESDMTIQLGYPPSRIDLLIGLKGADFDEAYLNRKAVVIDGVPINVIDRVNLINLKREAGRPQDLADIDNLSP